MNTSVLPKTKKNPRISEKHVGFETSNNGTTRFRLLGRNGSAITRNKQPVYLTGVQLNSGQRYFYLSRNNYNSAKKAGIKIKKNTSALRKGARLGLKTAATGSLTAAIAPPFALPLLGASVVTGGITGAIQALRKGSHHSNARNLYEKSKILPSHP
jgi:hypothetical protein